MARSTVPTSRSFNRNPEPDCLSLVAVRTAVTPAILITLLSILSAIAKPTLHIKSAPVEKKSLGATAVGPRVWHRVNEQPRPNPRLGSGIAYDIARKELVIHAGSQSSGTPTDTWVRRNGIWSLIPTSLAPSAAYGMGMVYDAARGESVLFGGRIYPAGSTDVTGETWTWNASTCPKGEVSTWRRGRAW